MKRVVKSRLSIAVLSDIHANLHALRAVTDHARQLGVDAIWNCGDSVGYGAFPDEVILYLKKSDILSIRGNYDSKVLKVPRKAETWQRSKSPVKWIAFNWAYNQLSAENLHYLKSLPENMQFNLLGWNILLVHGSPDFSDEPLFPDSPESRFRLLAESAMADIIVCGHTHQSFSRRVANTWFFNPGSVGRQDDGDPRSSYGILKLSRNGISFSTFRIQYDYCAAAESIRKNNLPDEFAQIILHGRGFHEL